MLHRLRGKLIDVGRFETLNQILFLIDSLYLKFKDKIIRVNILPVLGSELVIIYLLSNNKILIVNYEVSNKAFKVMEFKKLIHALSNGGYYEIFDLTLNDYLNDINVIRSNIPTPELSNRAHIVMYEVFRKNIINALTPSYSSNVKNESRMQCDLEIDNEMSRYVSKLDNIVNNIIRSKISKVYYIDNNAAGLLINDIRNFLKSVSNGALHIVSDVIDMWLITHEGITGLVVKLGNKVIYGTEACYYLLDEDLYKRISLSGKKLRAIIYEFK